MKMLTIRSVDFLTKWVMKSEKNTAIKFSNAIFVYHKLGSKGRNIHLKTKQFTAAQVTGKLLNSRVHRFLRTFKAA